MDATASHPPDLRYSKLHFILESANTHCPILRAVTNPTRCKVDKWAEMVECERFAFSKIFPAHTPSSNECCCTGNDCCGVFSQPSISRRTGWANALMISLMSGCVVMMSKSGYISNKQEIRVSFKTSICNNSQPIWLQQADLFVF